MQAVIREYVLIKMGSIVLDLCNYMRLFEKALREL
jgi:hypothetical protein